MFPTKDINQYFNKKYGVHGWNQSRLTEPRDRPG